MSERAYLLFVGKELSDFLQGNLDQAKRDVEQIPDSQFTNVSDEEISAHVYSRREVAPIELHEDRKEMDTQETEVDVRHDLNRDIFDTSRPALVAGLRIIVSIPFSGDASLWRRQPNTYTLNPPRGYVRTAHDDNGGCLEIVLESPSDTLGDGDAIKREIASALRSIRGYLKNSKSNVDAHNQQLRGHIPQCVASRRTRLGKHAEVAKNLNIPLSKKPGAPDLAALPIKRKLIKPFPPTPTTPPEWGLRFEDYQHILNVIRHEGRSFEATPQTFAKFDEEELRNIILAHLNGHYEGDASGETFRRAGKTDIRIESDNRAAFVGECKMWRGQKQLADALDQLLGYLTWRDCRTALIVFNRDVAGFSEIQRTLPLALEGHPGLVGSIDTSQPGEWQTRLHGKDDPDRQITVHVFLFNLYVPGRKQ
ncbi:MAG: hypothetical protein V3T70_00165 [Phycisphaerae bacterium]